MTVHTASTIETLGYRSTAIYARSSGGAGGNGGDGGSLVGNGGATLGSGPGGTVLVENLGALSTAGSYAHGIYALSSGGGGGEGGSGGANSSGDGGPVNVDNRAPVTTAGLASYAIFAQSIGGGGGSAGDAGGLAAIGGSASAGGNGGHIVLTNQGTLQTGGFDASAILAQSIGGGGGEGGGSGGLIIIGGSGSSSGNGGRVELTNTGSIATAGALSDAIFGQSVGGGGGRARNSGGMIAFGGSGGGGGHGGPVEVTNYGSLATTGFYACAISAESIGGGGGRGGGLVTAGAEMSLAIGGNAAEGADGGTVWVTSGVASLSTAGDLSSGIYAHSIGGGGG
ncbi:MAG: hypothetical protein FJ290_16120 [Planctomycetes bacterium]|nr:hypothetical protein [Planctomycetota bacterium]